MVLVFTWDGSSTHNAERDRVLPDGEPLTAELPEDLAANLGTLLGTAPVTTLADWVGAVRAHVETDAVGVTDLCHTDDPTGHYGLLHGERFDFACFYDAVVLAALADAPVEIHTESPSGAVITARTDGQETLAVEPASAVVSFGVADAVPDPDELDHAVVYAAVCPYVQAFPDGDAYAAWRASVSASTVGVPLAGATDIAAGLTD